MVALIEQESIAAWIWQPVPATMVMAVRGGGATVTAPPFDATPRPTEALANCTVS